MLRRIFRDYARVLVEGGGVDRALDTAVRLRVIGTSDAFLRVFLDSWLVLGIVVLAYASLRAPEALYFPATLLITGGLARLALHSGRRVLARWALIAPMALVICVAPPLLNGIRTPILANVPLLLMLTGWMLGRRPMTVLAAVFVAELLLLWQLEAHGLWTLRVPLRAPDVWLMVWLFDFAFAAVIVAALIGNFQTDFRREAALQQRLAGVLQYAETILQQSPLPIRVFDADGRCTRVNPAWADLFGVPVERLQGETLEQCADGGQAVLVQLCHEVRASMQPLRRELELVAAGDRRVWVEVLACPLEEPESHSLLLQLVDISDRKRVAEELEGLAFYDALTQLPNRRLFFDRLDEALRRAARQRAWGGMLLLDLDRFKELNDSCGHDTGDRLLVEVARRMKSNLRSCDTPARLGGDEFVVLVEDIGGTREQAECHLQTVRDKLHAALAAPYALGSVRHTGGASIGAVLFDGRMQHDREAIVRSADEAMYQAKRRAREGARSATAEGLHTPAGVV